VVNDDNAMRELAPTEKLKIGEFAPVRGDDIAGRHTEADSAAGNRHN
jgi:hypothetical protein